MFFSYSPETFFSKIANRRLCLVGSDIAIPACVSLSMWIEIKTCLYSNCILVERKREVGRNPAPSQ